jgi:hypothetical protein
VSTSLRVDTVRRGSQGFECLDSTSNAAWRTLLSLSVSTTLVRAGRPDCPRVFQSPQLIHRILLRGRRKMLLQIRKGFRRRHQGGRRTVQFLVELAVQRQNQGTGRIQMLMPPTDNMAEEVK